MSNPCINRWGLNAFWHNYWYSDSRYSLYLQQDKLFTTLVQLYLAYGTSYGSTFFRRAFWYKTATPTPQTKLEIYYRWITTRGREAHEVATARLRLSTAENFQTRVSVLRLNSWFVINIYWFQPDKLKNKRSKRTRVHYSVTPITPIQTTLAPLSKLNTSIRALTTASLLPSLNYNF